MGDWMDPYFINALLEHWHSSVWRLRDPTSPPMFFPSPHTLGYSHALVLYAPFYLPIRLFVHPFLAHTLTIFAVIEVGIVCLYLVLRRFAGASFVEAAVLSAFFLTSANVAGLATSIWSQRASVFLIPPIVQMALVSRQPGPARSRLTLAFVSGLSATLLFAHDFYTAQLALLFVLLIVAGALVERRRVIAEAIRGFWRRARPRERAAVAAAALLAAWSVYVWHWGGGTVEILGLAVRSHNWRKPTAFAVVSLGAFVWMRRDGLSFPRRTLVTPWADAFATGAVVGAIVFLWIYLAAYVEHRTFPEEHLLNALVARDLDGLSSPLKFLTGLSAYETSRPFLLVLTAAILGWLPWCAIDRTARLLLLGLVLVSAIVLVAPLRFEGFSFWRTFIEPLPGFGIIRDPKRIIYLYELFVALAIGILLARSSRHPWYRASVVGVLVALLIAFPNRQVFTYARPIAVYDRWVSAPVAIDPSCQSFFTRAASAEYTSRSSDMWSLYSIDSLFVALTRAIPTLNGYSAWSPGGWDLMNPTDADYQERVRQWIERHRLEGVCELDLDARTMTPAALNTHRQR